VIKEGKNKWKIKKPKAVTDTIERAIAIPITRYPLPIITHALLEVSALGPREQTTRGMKKSGW